MNRAIRKLRRDLEKPRPKDYEPFNHYAYNVFAWQAAYYVTHAKTEEERQEAERLRKVALQKRNERA